MGKICDTCGGIGQLSFFKGESRFLLSLEECPACAGTGYNLIKDDEKKENKSCNLGDIDKVSGKNN